MDIFYITGKNYDLKNTLHFVILHTNELWKLN